jgi:hypothetical protein
MFSMHVFAGNLWATQLGPTTAKPNGYFPSNETTC